MTNTTITIPTDPKITKKAQKIAEENRKKGKCSPVFTNAEDAIKWLNS